MPSQYTTAIPGLNALLRDLRALPKEYQGELRDASQVIADRYMVPAWQAAARRGAGPWGEKIAEGVRSKRDRIPTVVVGGRRRRTFSGGASPVMVRYPSHAGRVRDSIPAAFEATGWMRSVRTGYIGPAVQEWLDAVGRVTRKFNRGGVI